MVGLLCVVVLELGIQQRAESFDEQFCEHGERSEHGRSLKRLICSMREDQTSRPGLLYLHVNRTNDSENPSGTLWWLAHRATIVGQIHEQAS